MEVIEKVFPNTTEITSLGRLEIGGCDVQNLAQKYGTPFYLFDTEHIENVCDTYNTEFISRYKNHEKIFVREDKLPTQIVFYDEVRTGNSIEQVDFNINPKLKPID